MLSKAVGASPTELLAKVEEKIALSEGEAVDMKLERLQFAKPEYCYKIFTSLASIENTAVLQPVLSLLEILDQENRRVGHQ